MDKELDKLSYVELCDLLASKTLSLLQVMNAKIKDPILIRDKRKEVVAIQKILKEKSGKEFSSK